MCQFVCLQTNAAGGGILKSKQTRAGWLICPSLSSGDEATVAFCVSHHETSFLCPEAPSTLTHVLFFIMDLIFFPGSRCSGLCWEFAEVIKLHVVIREK